MRYTPQDIYDCIKRMTKYEPPTEDGQKGLLDSITRYVRDYPNDIEEFLKDYLN